MSSPYKPHAVCIPSPFQSHMKAMLKFSKLLHHKGFYITFVHTEFNHKRFSKANPAFSSASLPGFRFETIPDMVPDSDPDATQDVSSVATSIRNNFLGPFVELVARLNDEAAKAGGDVPRVSCVVADGFLSFALEAAERFGIPVVQFFSVSACGLLGFKQCRVLLEKGLAPPQEESSLGNEYLETSVDWIPGMKGLRLRDLPSIFWGKGSTDVMFNFVMEAAERASEASAVVVHTFDALERHVLEALSSSVNPNLYAIGPLQLLLNHLPESPLKPLPYSLWKEDTECLKWLDSQKPNSVLYVNFGSVVVLTPQQVAEFGWGLANSEHPFLWVIRPDLVDDDTSESNRSSSQDEFMVGAKERSLIVGWCPQEDVLRHPSTGGFLTHCGWNSTIESLSSGVPMLCHPGASDQQTNCWFCCNGWGVGLEIGRDVKRDQVERVVRELMEGEKGEQMKSEAMEWKKLAEEASDPQGSSFGNLEKLVGQLTSFVEP